MKIRKNNLLLGIIFLGLGALLTSKLFENWIFIPVGIVFYILGTLFLVFESSKSGKEIVSESTLILKNNLDEKFEIFRQQLEEIKATNINEPKVVEKINLLESEFEDWANKFDSSKRMRILQRKQSEIELLQKKEEFNSKWKNLYLEIFQTLEKILTTYNSKNRNNELSINFPVLPNSLYESESYPYFAKIQFDPENILYIILYFHPKDWNDIKPKILFKIDSSNINYGDKISGLMFSPTFSNFVLSLNEETNELKLVDPNIMSSDKGESINLESKSDVIRSFLIKIVENIIVDIESK